MFSMQDEHDMFSMQGEQDMFSMQGEQDVLLGFVQGSAGMHVVSTLTIS
jgi:hypothetical protein